ncbi:CBS domain containing protein [Candidatus Zixiibacteriota bacterium]|nr:CBS domain containing protein [candidate division Zixibacteria bacterium]
MLDTIDITKQVGEYGQKRLTTLQKDQSVGDALTYLRGRELAEKIVYFYVVDDSQKLVGVVPVRRLLMSRPERKISEIMVTRVIAVPHTATLLEASEIFHEHKLMALPIIDDDGKLIAVLDITIFSRETSRPEYRQEMENIFQMVGIHLTLGRNLSPLSGFGVRFPWLLSNIIGGLICAFIASRYESLISMVTILALFIPVVLSLSESVSMQSMTVALQTMPSSRMSMRLLWRFIRREFFPAALLGLGSGGLVGLIAYLWKRQGEVSITIGASIALAIMVACLLGIIIPGVVRIFRVDPKIASGPIVLALADIATMIFFFALSGWMLS